MTEAKPELVECRACGHQISVKAKFCPNCGDRITLKEKVLKPYQYTKNFLKRWNHYYQIEKQKEADERTRLAEIRRKRHQFIILLIGIMMLILGLLSGLEIIIK